MRFVANGTDARSALENRSNRTEFNNREKLYELPGWTLCSLSVWVCVCVFVLCAVCECVCYCIGVFVLVFFCIFSYFLWFFSFYCVGHKKERQAAISARTQHNGNWDFCWPQAELSNERVIDTIINKYRERRRKPVQRSVSQCISLSIDVVTCWNTQTRASCPISAYRL